MSESSTPDHMQQLLQSELREKETLLRLLAMLEGNNPEHVRQTLEEIRRIAGADLAIVTAQDGEIYRPWMWVGQASPELQDSFKQGIPQAVVRQLRNQLGRDYQLLDNQDHRLAPAMQAFGISASLVLGFNHSDSLEGLVLHRFERREGWSEAELRLLRSAAHTLGVVITRIERTRQLEARNRELETVALVSQGLNRAFTLEEAAETLAQQIIKLTQSNQSSVKVITSDGQSLQNIASHGFPQLSGSLVPRGTGLSWLALATQQPLVTQDSLSDPRVYFAPLKEIDQWPRSVAYVPMFGADGEALGVLGLAYWEPERVRETDLQTLSIIANIAAATLERFKTDAALRNRNRELETVLNLSEALKTTISLEEALEIALQKTLELTCSRSVVLFTLSPDEQLLVPTWQAGSLSSSWTPIPRPLGLAWLAWQTRTLQFTQNAALDKRSFDPQRPHSDLPRSRAAVPLFGFDRKVAAVLGITRDLANGFSAEELKVFGLIGEVVSSALERVEATAQLMRQLHESQVLLNTIKAIVKPDSEEAWSDLLRAAVELVPGAQRGSLLIRDGDEYAVVAQHGYDDRLLGIRMNPVVEGYWFDSADDLRQGRARIGRREFVAQVIENDQRHLEPEVLEKFRTFGKMAEVQCTVCIPICSNDELVAFINLDNFSDELALDEESVQVAQRFALQVAALVAARRQKESLDTTY